MKIPTILATLVSTAALPGALFAAEADAKKVTFVDDVLPILENKCTNCHNPDEAKGGLDLSSFSATLAGGSGGEIVISQDPDSSRFFTLSAHKEEPIMPPKGSAATEAELKIMSDWIAGGLLETKNSKARKSDKPKVDLDSISATGKPEGPPAMPEHLLLEPEVLTDRPNAVPALAHSPWAPIVAVAGQKQVLLYHSEDFDLLGVLPYPEGFPQTLSFSPNGAYLTCGGGRGGKAGNVVTWDLKTGERILEVGKEYDIVLGADVSPDLKTAVLGGPKRNIKIWDTVAGEETSSIKKHPDWLLTAAYSPDGILFATGGRNGGLYVWEAGTGYEFYTLKGHTGAVTDIDWRSDGNVLASCSEDGQVILWEMNGGTQIKKWAAHGGGALGIDVAPGGRIATVGRDKSVKIWEADGKAVRTIAASDDVVLSVAFSHDNERVFTGDFYGKVKVWNVETGAEIALIEPNPPTIEEQLAYSRKRIQELTGELPKLEQGIAAVSKELTDARNTLAAVDKKVADATKERDTQKGAIAKLDGQVKALTPQVDAANKLVATRKANTKKHSDAAVAAENVLKQQQAVATAQQAELQKRETALQAAAAAFEAAKVEAAKPALDAAKKQQHDQLAAARAAAEKGKQAADAAVNAKVANHAKLVAARDAAKKTLDAAAAPLNAAKQALAGADARAKTAAANLAKAAAALAEASKDGKQPAPTLVQARDAAAKVDGEAKAALAAAQAQLTKASGDHANATAVHTAADGQVKAADAELAKLRADQKAKTNAFVKADAAHKPLRDALAAGTERVKKAQADLAAKTAAQQQATKARDEQKTRVAAEAKKLADATAKRDQAKAALAKVKAEEDAAVADLGAKQKALADARTQLAAAGEALKKAEATLAGAAKEKEGAKAKYDAIAKKDADTKKSVELAKAELETSKFLQQKWQAAAINLTAHKESEELDDMTFDLEDMKEKEVVKKTEVAEATKARAEAEKTLADAKKTAEAGRKELQAKSTTVLERALELVASRAVAQLREEAVQQQPAAETAETLVAEIDVDVAGDPLALADMPEEQETEEVIGAVAAEALAYKSPDEIRKEVDSLRQRLSDIESFLQNSYTEADQTSKTVAQADRVARETPKVVAERTQKEKEAARLLAEAEAERKRQETALAEQKKRIEQLRKEYLATLPKREEE